VEIVSRSLNLNRDLDHSVEKHFNILEILAVKWEISISTKNSSLCYLGHLWF